MRTITADEIEEMPIQQKIQLVEDVWDSIAKIPENVGIPQWHKQELETRLQAYHQNPKEGSSWDDVKKRIID